jgi:hypothetical protein
MHKNQEKQNKIKSERRKEIMSIRTEYIVVRPFSDKHDDGVIVTVPKGWGKIKKNGIYPFVWNE